MSLKAKIAAGVATFALAGGGLGTVGTLSASAATPSCGHHCKDLYTLKFGPRFLLDTFQARAAANQEVILFQATNSDPAEDFVIKDLGTLHSLSTMNRHSLITRKFKDRYGRFHAYEFQYEPLGVNSHFCASTWPGVIAQPGYKVRLERCGMYSNSIWVAGATPPHGSPRPSPSPSLSFAPHGSISRHVIADRNVTHRGYSYFINGATDSVSDPLVLSYPDGYPTDMPRPWLNVQPLTDYSDGTVFDNQQWKYVPGPVRGGM